MPRIKVKWAFLLAAVTVGVVAGCSTQARRVDCEGRLRPINAPVPVSRPVSIDPKAEQTP